MYSHFRISQLLFIAIVGTGCQPRETVVIPQEGTGGPLNAEASALAPAGGNLADVADVRALPYLENAEAVITGKRLYNQFNCVGCHFNGGGGIGPALMDDVWTYGGRLDQIYNSIYQGRPNGMPAWGGKLMDEQIWQIAAYVRSMSLPETLNATSKGSTPSQHPAPLPLDADRSGGWRRPVAAR